MLISFVFVQDDEGHVSPDDIQLQAKTSDDQVDQADVLDALTHKRIYKDSWSFDEAAAYIVEHSGIQFDPHLVELF